LTVAAEIPVVDYLILGAEPHLVALRCEACDATYFGRRNACASCGGVEFTPEEVGTEGTVRAFTIVAFAAPGVAVPFVSAIVDCDGTSVRANLVNTPADPDHVGLGMKVKLTTFPMGTDTAGTEAVGFGFEPIAS
jgi:uncharacterized protein